MSKLSQEILNKLKALYYDPETGLLSKSKFAEKATELLNIGPADVRKFVDSLNVNQIYAEKQRKYGKIYAPAPGRLVMDLIDLSNVSTHNKGYKWLQTIIDMHSRRVWVFPLKTKQPGDVLPGLKKAFAEVRENPRTIENDISLTTDAGTEYKGAVAKYLADNKIQHFVGNPSEGTDRRTAHIESFNRTILNYIKRLWAVKGKLNWVDGIQQLATNYNNTRHSSIKAKPISVWNGTVKSPEVKEPIIDSLRIGDFVRVRLPVDDFTKKGRQQIWSTVVYKIVDREGVRYRLLNAADVNNEHREPLKTLYYPRDLLKVTEPTVESVIEDETSVKPFQEAAIDSKVLARKKNKQHRDFNKGAVGHEVKEITDEGEVVYKERLQPVREKREIKKPSRLDL